MLQSHGPPFPSKAHPRQLLEPLLLYFYICLVSFGSAAHLNLSLQCGALTASQCGIGAYVLFSSNASIDGSWIAVFLRNSATDLQQRPSALLAADGTDIIIRSTLLQPPSPPLGLGYSQLAVPTPQPLLSYDDSPSYIASAAASCSLRVSVASNRSGDDAAPEWLQATSGGVWPCRAPRRVTLPTALPGDSGGGPGGTQRRGFLEYNYYHAAATQAVAAASCLAAGGDLLMPRSEIEIIAVQEALLMPYRRLWMGLRRVNSSATGTGGSQSLSPTVAQLQHGSSSYKWSAGAVGTYQAFATGTEAALPADSCVQYDTVSGAWHPSSCTGGAAGFACEARAAAAEGVRWSGLSGSYRYSHITLPEHEAAAVAYGVAKPTDPQSLCATYGMTPAPLYDTATQSAILQRLATANAYWIGYVVNATNGSAAAPPASWTDGTPLSYSLLPANIEAAAEVVTGGGNGDDGGGSMLCGALFPTALPPPAAGATNTTSAINISSTASGGIRGGSWMLSRCESAAGSPFCTGSALGPMLTPPGIIPLAPTDNATGATGQVLYVFLGSGAAAVAANFSTAASRCRQLGGTLAVFDGNGALEGLASWHSAVLGSVWLGLRLPSATWADGTDLSYSNWAGGVTPAGINGTCAMLALTAKGNGKSKSTSTSNGVGGALQRGGWGAVSCHSLLPVVCEGPRGGAPAVSEPEDEDGSGLHPSLDPSTQPARNVSHGSSSYFLYDGVRLTWDDAAVFCGARHTGGQLPSIASAEEAGAVLSLLSGSPYWVGLSDTAEEGSFVWADGNSSRPLPWSGSSGTTLQGQSTENDCVSASFNASGLVSSTVSLTVRPCNVNLPYVCSVSGTEDLVAATTLDKYPVMLRRQGSLTYGMYEYLFYRTAQYDNDEAEEVCQSAGGHLFSPLEPSEMSWVAAAAVRLLEPSVDSAGSSTNASNPTATNAVPAGSPGVIQLGMVIRPNSNLLLNPSPTTSETSSSLTTAIVTSRDGLGTWLPEGVIVAVANATVLTNNGTEAICPQLLTATGDWRLNGSCTDKLPFVCKRL
ncbi:hypothetical protein Vafri_5988, partial [Volvox africanus]